MDDTTKNELAELAERLDIIVFGLVTDGHPCDETIDIRKAQLIVAELANVNTLGPKHIPGDISLYTAYAKCRAIAEEGYSK